MLGINGLELIVLVVLGVLILGPERLPEYAAQLGQLVRNLRRMANGAREQLREEMGPELDDVDWRKLDPRQYDPRRIIKDALTEEFSETLTGPPSTPTTPHTGASAVPAPALQQPEGPAEPDAGKVGRRETPSPVSHPADESPAAPAPPVPAAPAMPAESDRGVEASTLSGDAR
ncbi:MAG: Twin-arginine translocation protein TatB [uncultured Arthrobacter sp.]|uniref:Sec-independent protein translocase protein TatB n=1 Tax=uncultured Arthrobacter sp. TaxID=114050 RepID=A0A6J4HIR0_9MICC|nr:twin-arginine translocase TatA/TatE family subunit [uncultured Arthrobacter sp.]CAA9222344.1 MAG: Twin-arginine translocation protein TatB [uncultured Arthrobacter sp.]